METKNKNWSNIMSNSPDNEKAVDEFEVDIMEVILKHRAEDGISALDVGAELVNILFVMATTQPDPKAAVDHLKEALDNVCIAWFEAKKPDLLKGYIERCLAAKVKAAEGPDPRNPYHDQGFPMPQRETEEPK
jgi:hypothetical protein